MLRAGIFSIFYLFSVILLQAQTQQGYCGNGHNAEWDAILTERLLENKRSLAENPIQFRNTVYVPIRFHMVANAGGFGRVTHAQVLDQLCKLNEDFAGFDIQFYIKALSENINNNGIYSTQSTSDFVMNQLKDPAALNVWIVDAAVPSMSNVPPGGLILGYYSPFRDWVVIRKDNTNSTSTTLSHEIGHFFSLKHTHNGWDATPWTPAIGNPAPAMSPGGVPTERQDGSNCNTAGDYICDTPPDYNGYGFPTCNYNIAQDPTGTLIDPDEKLFMSYFDNCPRNEYYFSQTQQNLIRADYNHSSRSYIRPNVTPNLTQITQAASPTFPISNEFAPGYNAVSFQWNAVPGADFYLLEIDVAQQFTSSPLRIVVPNATSRTVNTLLANRTYYWRVRPYNAYRTCAPFSPTAVFRTNSMVVSTREITDLNSWTVSPNPLVAQGSIQISLQASRSFDGAFSLYNTAGQVIQRYGIQRVNSGDTHLEFDVENLQPGVYMLALDHEEGREIRRVIVAR